MTALETPKTPRAITEAMLRSTIEADRLTEEHINDPQLRETHIHTAANGYIAALAMETLRSYNPAAADALAQRLAETLDFGDIFGPAYRAAKAFDHDPDQWITEFEERAARRKSAGK